MAEETGMESGMETGSSASSVTVPVVGSSAASWPSVSASSMETLAVDSRSSGSSATVRVGSGTFQVVSRKPRRPMTSRDLLVTLPLALAALVLIVLHAMLLFDPNDTHHLETPLALALARQVIDGPETLYGPYPAGRPWVIIHPPLYYRMCLPTLWGLTNGLGLPPEQAAMVAGRSLSALALVVVVILTTTLARLDGASNRAGLWAGLILLGTALTMSYPVTTRPDLLGVALQTLGLTLTLNGLKRAARTKTMPEVAQPGEGWVVAGFVSFGLAVCVKQHDVVLGGVGLAATLFGVGMKWLRWQTFAAALALGLAIPAGYLFAENRIAQGRLVEALLTVPGEMRVIHPVEPAMVWELLKETLRRLAGPLLVAAAIVLVRPQAWARGRWLDLVLAVALLGEAGATLGLYTLSSGAWLNYALQASVLLAVLVGRALDRALVPNPGSLKEIPSPSQAQADLWRWGVVGLAGLVMAADNFKLARHEWTFRRAEAQQIEAALNPAGVLIRSAEERYFTHAPQYNRRLGRITLAHDEWLYQGFEALALAEPRTLWLKEALTKGGVKRVFTPDDSSGVPGLGNESLSRLGYRRIGRFGRFVVWDRPDPPGG